MANSLVEGSEPILRATYATISYMTFAPNTSTPTAPGDPSAQYSHDGVTWHDCANTPPTSAYGMLTLLPVETDSLHVWVRITDGDAIVDQATWHAETVYGFNTATSPAMGVSSATSTGLTAAADAVPANLPFYFGRLLGEFYSGNFLGWRIQIVGGTGEGQQRRIRGFDMNGGGPGLAQFAISDAWTTTPDATSTFVLVYVGEEGQSAHNMLEYWYVNRNAENGLPICDALGRVAASVEEITADGQQDAADALKLAPSVGAAADGSAQAILESTATDVDSVLADTATIIADVEDDGVVLAADAVDAAALADDAIAEIVAALNNLSPTQAQAACAAALAAYDAATGTEVGNLAATTIITVPSAEQTDVARCYADSAPWAITVQTDAGVAVDLTDLTLYMGIDEHQTTLYAAASVKLDSTVGGGLTVISAVNGQIEVDAGELDGLAVGDWWYTLRRANVAGETLTLVRGKLEVRWAI